uniref:Uncharacterized protein n=1 Tax=Tanacetum cinerariifolium TaxID=118510 RepID=A0A699HJN2_TANCI|nr:hypothetical protein [Tanacetum cinerariifolium]
MKILPVLTSNSTDVGTNVGVTASFQLSRIHYHMLMLMLKALKVKHSTSRLLMMNKNVIGQKAQDHVKFCNSNNHELLHHQRYSKSNNEVVFGEIVSLRSILWEIVSLDEEEEFASFQDKYEHVGQKHKLIKKVKSR